MSLTESEYARVSERAAHAECSRSELIRRDIRRAAGGPALSCAQADQIIDALRMATRTMSSLQLTLDAHSTHQLVSSSSPPGVASSAARDALEVELERLANRLAEIDGSLLVPGPR